MKELIMADYKLQDDFLEIFFSESLASDFYLTGGTALSRFYLGLHYLSDIIAGGFIGYLIGFIIGAFLFRLGGWGKFGKFPRRFLFFCLY